MKVNIDPRLNVDEKQHDKTLKVKSNIDDSDEILEITATIPPEKIPVCNQTLALKMGVQKTYRGSLH